MSNWLQESRDAITLARAKREAAEAQKRDGSWWLNLPRDQFQAEVKRRHACLLNSRNPSVRSLSKPI